MLKVIFAVIIVGTTLTGCEKISTKIDLECKDNILHYNYERKALFPFEYVESAHKGIATYANDGKVIKCKQD